MNYYERINQSIDFIESHLTENFSIEDAAKEAFMSTSNFYRMFLSIAGFSVKEYIRRRRLAYAAKDIRNLAQLRIIDIALKYGYTSADAFTRSFKEEFGVTPSELKNTSQKVCLKNFRRINIMDEYFELNDEEHTAQYPDIKLLKKLPNIKVACFKYFGDDPESHAFAKMKEWVQQNGIRFNERNDNGENAYRIFGFNNPDPSNCGSDNQETLSKETYGYEVCVTVDSALYETLPDAPEYGGHQSYNTVMHKTIPGGMFAVVSIKRNKDSDIGTEIIKGWSRFNKWLELSKYTWGACQYLEEHLGFSEDDEHTGGVDLYMPIRKPELKATSAIDQTQLLSETIPAYRVAFYRISGNDSEKIAHQAWHVMLNFAKKYKLDKTSSRIFMYGSGFNPNPPFFHEIMITVPINFTLEDGDIRIKEFSGGHYMTVMTDLEQLLQTWQLMELWRKETKTKAGKHQWVQEFFLDNFDFPEKAIKVCYPLTL